MPAYPEMNDDFAMMDSSPDWSIYKTTSLLSDSLSMYSDQDHYYQSDIDFTSTPPKIIKAEPMTEMWPDVQHYSDWQTKYIDQWQPQDCLLWAIHELRQLIAIDTLPQQRLERFTHISGIELKQMTLDDFTHMSPEYGSELYNRLQRFKIPSMYNSYLPFDQWNNPPLKVEEPFSSYHSPTPEPHRLTDLDSEIHMPTVPIPSAAEGDSSGYRSDSSEETTEAEPAPVPVKRGPGRPRGTRRKKKPEKLGRLWEFIRDLLLNPSYNPSMIRWEDYEEGTFRFVHSDQVAKLWGSKKDNTDMNYEKLSRAMRYYYKSQVLLPVYGKRLVYKFGPTATGWRSERPILCQS